MSEGKILHITATVDGIKYGNMFRLSDGPKAHAEAMDLERFWLAELAQVAGSPDEGSLEVEVLP